MLVLLTTKIAPGLKPFSCSKPILFRTFSVFPLVYSLFKPSKDSPKLVSLLLKKSIIS